MKVKILMIIILSLHFFRPLMGQNSDSTLINIKLNKDKYIQGDTIEVSIINLTDDTLYIWDYNSVCLFKENNNNIWGLLSIIPHIKGLESRFILYDTISLKWNQKINVPDSDWQHEEVALIGQYKFELKCWKSWPINKLNRYDYYVVESKKFDIE